MIHSDICMCLGGASLEVSSQIICDNSICFVIIKKGKIVGPKAISPSFDDNKRYVVILLIIFLSKFQVNSLLHFSSITGLTRLEAKNISISEPKHIDELEDQDCKRRLYQNLYFSFLDRIFSHLLNQDDIG